MEPRDKQLLRPWDDDLFFEIDTVASATECTGLIPALPLTEAQAQAYTDLYSIPRPVINKIRDDPNP